MSEHQDEENTRVLAVTCYKQYSAGQWDECLKSLQELASHNDPRVKHNELVVRYYKAGCYPSATESLVSSLNKLSSLPENHGLTCARYNMAVLKFHLQHFSTAFDILVGVLNSIDHQEKYLAMRSAFLLIETCLRMKTLDRKTFKTTLELLEKTFPQLKKSAGAKPETNGREEADIRMPPPDALESTLHLIKARLLFNFAEKGYKPARFEMKGFVESLTDDPQTQSAIVLSHLECIQGNYAVAIKELNKHRPLFSDSIQGLEQSMMYFNSLGCIHVKMEKFAAASSKLQRLRRL
eukprot:TRINITY_DN3460_c0_g1_i2.p1 TRINITY_DN3460_c0_g1~~TRINITY_DN3460_c0_g1_i2.p1  ORF type:complete len:294 (+),score=52.33 TRINITY_DN3460_c0_g1_i2:31-912(+)